MKYKTPLDPLDFRPILTQLSHSTNTTKPYILNNMTFPARIKVYKRGSTLFGQDIDISTNHDVGETYEVTAAMINMGLTAIGTYNLNTECIAYTSMIQVIG